MSPLRRRLIEKLQLHRKAERTIEAYVAAVAELAKFAGRSPERTRAPRPVSFAKRLAPR